MQKEKYKTPHDYENDLYKKLETFIKQPRTSANILKIKDITQPIHNHITYLMGAQFLRDLELTCDKFKYEEMCNNGFDIEIHAKNENEKNIVAEIKGNIPVNGNTYGSAQKTGIKNDISYLMNGKKKNTYYTTKESLEGVYRFLILLENNKEAIKNLIKNLKYPQETFKVWEETSLDQNLLDNCAPDVINVVFVKL